MGKEKMDAIDRLWELHEWLSCMQDIFDTMADGLHANEDVGIEKMIRFFAFTLERITEDMDKQLQILDKRDETSEKVVGVLEKKEKY